MTDDLTPLEDDEPGDPTNVAADELSEPVEPDPAPVPDNGPARVSFVTRSGSVGSWEAANPAYVEIDGVRDVASDDMTAAMLHIVRSGRHLLPRG